MSCEYCRNVVELVLVKLNGVLSVEVNLDENYVCVEYNDLKVIFENMKEVIEE